MAKRSLDRSEERSSCGVGFVAARGGAWSRQPLLHALVGLECLEHRGACLSDGVTGDGAGIMTDIPFALLGHARGEIALASLMLLGDDEVCTRALKLIDETFAVMGVEVIEHRRVPTQPRVLGTQARATLPKLVQLVLKWPAFCRREASFSRLLYLAKQKARTRLSGAGLQRVVTFASLSPSTVVYKALTRAEDLASFYPDLQSSTYRTRFAVFHRRFSTNTRTSWDKAQPFRLIAHNGEINTIAGNRAWSYSREQALGLPRDELLTHESTSDSGNLNEMVEAMKYRSAMPYVEDVLAIMIPPADVDNNYYRFWSRAVEPWDGPALVTYCDGTAIGARIDRNGFRPCRWAMTDEHFFLSSEAGVFNLEDDSITQKGTLRAGSGVKLVLGHPAVLFRDPSQSDVNREGTLDPRLSSLVPIALHAVKAKGAKARGLDQRKALFGLGSEELDRVLGPMLATGKEPIGSMGDTAALAVLSDQPRSFFDFFFQTFAQVTNPPLDYLRERIVTDLAVTLGRSPNIFLPKELIPPRAGLLLASPILSLDQLAALEAYAEPSAETVDCDEGEVRSLTSATIDICFAAQQPVGALREALESLAEEALSAVRQGASVLILSDLKADDSRLPAPSLLALRAVVTKLNQEGHRLRSSIVVATGDARTPHHVAALIGFGATAVCPALAFTLARVVERKSFGALTAPEREENLRRALEGGLLKIMSKVGISVVRSYASAKRFSAVGLGDDVIDRFFPNLTSPVGGLGLDEIETRVRRRADMARDQADDEPLRTFQFKEKNRGSGGEAHAMTARRARQLQEAIGLTRNKTLTAVDEAAWKEFADNKGSGPVSLRHLLELKPAPAALALDEVESAAAIMRRFGSGSMSFGALSALAQRDLIAALRSVGGRSGSGEGGENPWYYRDGTTASVKQIASARFGVTAEYLLAGDEFEIKIAQGAKPGEGGQLMGIKVTEEIAAARFALPGVDLISPPPLHDIYSIEDLKQLIYELKQLKPGAKVCVKLVSGASVGTIAVGAAKAGADAIQISGGDGGTAAATLSSMKHAGMPWELGLASVQEALLENDLRSRIELRVDGGLATGEDLVMATILGADGFAFGKILLIAQGCIMARVCEKNTCPRGIATHDEKFLAKYRGSEEAVVRVLQLLAEDTRAHLARLGRSTLDDVRGDRSLWRERSDRKAWMRARGLDLSLLLQAIGQQDGGQQDGGQQENQALSGNGPTLTERNQALSEEGPGGAHTQPPRPQAQAISVLNQRIVALAQPVLKGTQASAEFELKIKSTDRAALTTLAGVLAQRSIKLRQQARHAGQPAGAQQSFSIPDHALRYQFCGSAGQGFAGFITTGIETNLIGEANDAVAKSMSGGRVIIRPPPSSPRVPEENAIIGNCALYGATGGELFITGRAGDRFAVRNSGARAVVEGVGMHCAEYMTGGLVVVLGQCSHNIGAGMTGGKLAVREDALEFLHADYVVARALEGEDAEAVRKLLQLHATLGHSPLGQRLLEGDLFLSTLKLVVPRSA